MSNVIAVIWDFDKTLVNGYMQDPIFKAYKVDSTEFWQEVAELPKKYEEQGVRINKDTIYLNHFINNAKKGGCLEGLNNAKLRAFGKQLKFYNGVPEIFSKTEKLIENNTAYQEYGIKVEHYVVSTGFAEEIRGSEVMQYVKGVWGCEFIESIENESEPVISEIGYAIDNTSKTKALFEINKGIPLHPEIDVNAKMDEKVRRVRFENMIYIADGPSDIPAFSLVNKNGGSTFAIYPAKDKNAFRQVEQMRQDGRIQMYAEADYSEGTTAYMWICNTIERYAQRMYLEEKGNLEQSVSNSPRHLNV